MLKRFFTNWRASAAGLATLAAVGFKISQHGFDLTDIATITTGVGLLGAKGNNVTGGTKDQDGGTVPAQPHQKTKWQKQHPQT
jgi:hypothetical protein